jgi:hypothetical protein
MTTPRVTETVVTREGCRTADHTEWSAAAAREGRAMNSDEQRADRWARLARGGSDAR